MYSINNCENQSAKIANSCAALCHYIYDDLIRIFGYFDSFRIYFLGHLIRLTSHNAKRLSLYEKLTNVCSVVGVPHRIVTLWLVIRLLESFIVVSMFILLRFFFSILFSSFVFAFICLFRWYTMYYNR